MDEPGQLFRHGVFERTGGLYLPSASYNQTRIRPVPLGLRRTVEYNRHFRLYHERQPGTLRKYARPVRSFHAIHFHLFQSAQGTQSANFHL